MGSGSAGRVAGYIGPDEQRPLRADWFGPSAGQTVVSGPVLVRLRCGDGRLPTLVSVPFLVKSRASRLVLNLLFIGPAHRGTPGSAPTANGNVSRLWVTKGGLGCIFQKPKTENRSEHAGSAGTGTSHAAVGGRGPGRAAVCRADEKQVEYKSRRMRRELATTPARVLS